MRGLGSSESGVRLGLGRLTVGVALVLGEEACDLCEDRTFGTRGILIRAALELSAST